MDGLRIGRLFGIDVRVHASLLVVFALIVMNLGLGSFPAMHPDWSVGTVWTTAFVAAFLFVVSILLHELAHALVATAYGIPVRNVVLFLFGGVSNIEREPHSPLAEFLMAVVGPFTSLLLGGVFLALAGLAAGPFPPGADPAAYVAALGPLATLGLWLGPTNLALGVFNLLPGYPLDGGRVFHALVWGATGDEGQATWVSTLLGRGIGAALVAAGILMAFGITFPFLGTGAIAGLWLVLIGWFLTQAASASYTANVLGRVLADVPVSELMTARVLPITAHTTVARLVDRLMEDDQRVYPVVDGDRLVGVVRFEDVRRVAREAWAETPVTAIMTSRRELETVARSTPAAEAFRAMTRGGVDAVPVVEHDHLLGLVRREDVFRWLQLHGDVPA